MKIINLTFLLLMLPFGVNAMHKSSSIVPSKNQELCLEQEIKVANEVTKQPSKLKLVNNFRRKDLNNFLPKDLSNIVLEYAPIDTQYSCSQDFEAHGTWISNIIQLKNISTKAPSSSLLHTAEIGYPIASCSTDHTIKIWALVEGSYLPFQTIKNDDWVTDITELRDGSLVFGSEYGEIKIWKYKKEDDDYHCSQIFRAHTGIVNKIIQLKNGSLASCSKDKTIKIWKLKDDGSYYCHQTLKDNDNLFMFYNITQLQDGSLAACSDSAMIHIWKLKNDDDYHTNHLDKDEFFNDPEEDYHSHVTNINQLRDGSIVTCYENKMIKIWTLKDGIYYCSNTIQGHDKKIRNLIQLEDSSLVSCSADCTIKIWTLKDGSYHCSQTLEGHTDSVVNIIQLKDGSLASCSPDRTIKIWKNELTKTTIPDTEEDEVYV